MGETTIFDGHFGMERVPDPLPNSCFILTWITFILAFRECTSSIISSIVYCIIHLQPDTSTNGSDKSTRKFLVDGSTKHDINPNNDTTIY